MGLNEEYVGGIENRRRCSLTSFLCFVLVVIFAYVLVGRSNRCVVSTFSFACFRHYFIFYFFIFSHFFVFCFCFEKEDTLILCYFALGREAVFISVLFRVASFPKQIHFLLELFGGEII